MTTKAKETKEIGKRYVTLEDAAAESGTTDRTIRRWIKKELVHHICDRTGHLRVDLDDVLACRKLSSESPMRYQLKQIQSMIQEHDRELATLIDQIQVLQNQLEQQILATQLARATGGSPLQQADLEAIQALLGGKRKRSGPEEQLAKRDLPAGTIRLVAFAKQHHLSVHDLKTLYHEGHISLTVYERGGQAKRNKQEWWVVPEQSQQIAAYYESQALPFEPCSQCPHAKEADDAECAG